MRGFLRGAVPTTGACGGSVNCDSFGNRSAVFGFARRFGRCFSSCSGRNLRIIAKPAPPLMRGIPAGVRKTRQGHDGALKSVSHEVAMWDLPPGDVVLYGLSLVALAAQAMTAALAAGRRSMDWVGVCLLGCITALGGGTIRDVLLGHYPLLWVLSP